GMQSYFDSIAALPENQTEVPIEEMERYFAFLINNERQKFGYAALTPDTIAQKVAQDQATDLATRRVLSHQDANGNNPDRRYTLAGGTDLVAE
ncbi:CAP domain-containing protein, partial [Acinetobacter baumannii]